MTVLTGPALIEVLNAYIADADNRVKSAEHARDRFLRERNEERIKSAQLANELEMAKRAQRVAETELALARQQLAEARRHKAA